MSGYHGDIVSRKYLPKDLRSLWPLFLEARDPNPEFWKAMWIWVNQKGVMTDKLRSSFHISRSPFRYSILWNGFQLCFNINMNGTINVVAKVTFRNSSMCNWMTWNQGNTSIAIVGKLKRLHSARLVFPFHLQVIIKPDILRPTFTNFESFRRQNKDILWPSLALLFDPSV